MGIHKYGYKKVHNNFLMGVKFGTSWKNFQEFSKTPSWRGFLKNILKSVILEKKVKRFPWKKIKWKKFLKGFLWKIEAGRKILKGYPLFHTRASLARAEFKRDFLDNHGGMPM